MENLPLAIALSAWFTYTMWAHYTLRVLQQHNRHLNQELDHSRQYADKLRDELLALLHPAPAMLPEIYTPEQMSRHYRNRKGLTP